jgi:hypothetical protein
MFEASVNSKVNNTLRQSEPAATLSLQQPKGWRINALGRSINLNQEFTMRTRTQSRFSRRLALLVGALALAVAAPAAMAQHYHGGYGGGYHGGGYGYHGGYHGGGFLAGALTAGIVGGLIYDSTRPTVVYNQGYGYTGGYYPQTVYAPTYYPPQPVVYQPAYAPYYPAPVVYRRW